MTKKGDLCVRRNSKIHYKETKNNKKKPALWERGGCGHSHLSADFALCWGSWNITPAKSNG